MKSLELKNLEIRAVFVGFSSDAFIGKVIEYGKKEKDWVYYKIMEKGGNEDTVRDMLKSLQQKSINIKAQAVKNGYKFFAVDEYSFEEYKEDVVKYLLK